MVQAPGIIFNNIFQDVITVGVVVGFIIFVYMKFSRKTFKEVLETIKEWMKR